ncbi:MULTISPECIES: gamma-glutamyl-gamma-aminobutyrate hydrolase family protein [Paracoccaceae]|jgi:putative glutamine amidotransferase|uniref:gamma-glutamyl-gamma-aminobutyrate hydrolase family protein n=1 Tax=Rhodobacterales TaxID=204455 RepID=UPI001D0B969D|nr:gamma-glutamyl-gamma-aminobutyrate hydrolase family protein [Boseongicola sp. H5]
MKPRIGVTVSHRSGWRIFPLMALGVWLAGGKALRWQSAEDVDISAVSGVIIGGGDDIAPALYGGEIVIGARLDEARDEMEKSVLEQAFDAGLPILGICRGSQMLNVVLGGDLDQDAYATTGGRRFNTILPRKSVHIKPGSRLARIAGFDVMKVNAMNTQAVCKLGTGLAVAARDEDGMIQAVERVKEPFALGVQWHPEHLFYARRQRALFRALVAAAKACQQDRPQLGAVDRQDAQADPA